MAIGELITAVGTSIATTSTAWMDVVTEFIKLPVEIWSTIFGAVTA
jgi:hypothetical protein